MMPASVAPTIHEQSPTKMDEEEQVSRTKSYKSATDSSKLRTLSGKMMVTEINDFTGLLGSTAQKIEKFVRKHPVVVFSKATCPFSIEVKQMLGNLDVPITVFDVNLAKDGRAVMKSLKATTGVATVPNVFIKGSHIGGCNKVKELDSSGKLMPLVGDLIERANVGGLIKRPRGEVTDTLLWFPHTTNNKVIRLVGVQVVIVCTVSIIFYEEYWTPWLATGLMLDFIVRFAAGASFSPLGMTATVIASFFKPDFRPGPPKQFAAICGICFTLPGAAMWHAGIDVGGAVMFGLLMGAASLEAFGDFCLGCVFFGIAIDFGLIPPSIYRIHTNTREDIKKAWNYANIEAPKRAQRADEVIHADGATPVGLTYKRVKSDEWTLVDFHVIRNMQVGYFAMPLAIAGLAVAFKLASPWLNDFVSSANASASSEAVASYHIYTDVWRTIATIAATIFIIFLALYAIRLVFFPKKCRKEWHDPMRSPSFGMITISCVLFSFLAYDEFESANFGRALFWIGSVIHTLLTIAKFGEWVGLKYELEHIHPSWMVLPVGGLVSALVAPIVPAIVEDGGHREHSIGTNQNIELANFFYSFSFLMWLILFTITFFKVVTTHNSDDRLRTQVFIWIAPPAVAGMADFMICFSRATVKAPAVASVGQGQCANNLSQFFWTTIMLELGLLWAFLPYINFFARHKFDMSYWNFVFPLDVVASIAAMSYSVNGFMITEMIFVSTLAIACVANIIAILHTVTQLLRRQVIFTPENKWGPLSFLKLTHEGFRGAIPKLERNLISLDIHNRQSVAEFVSNFKKFSTLHHEHSEHEDKVIFREFQRYFPNQGKTYCEDHVQDRQYLAEVHEKLKSILAFVNGEENSLKEADADRLVHDLKNGLPSFFTSVRDHLRGEEDNLSPIGRKHIPLAVQKQLIQKVFDMTSVDLWAIIIPYTLENMPRIPQRKKYVKALLWGLGMERAQMLGRIIYKGCDAVMWAVLTDDIPEIIPRGAPGWRRYY